MNATSKLALSPPKELSVPSIKTPATSRVLKQNSFSHLLRKGIILIKETLIALLAASGIRIDQITTSRIIAMSCLVIGFALHYILAQYISFTGVIIYFIALFLIRYVFLFGGFLKGGFCPRLIEKYGERRGWNIYEIATSIMFFQRGLSFGLLTAATQWTIFHLPIFQNLNANSIETVRCLCIGLGAAMTIVGLWVNIAATFVIGIDTYYYKDLFLKRAIVPFKVAGPYKYFSNPMYGVGQLPGYGAALMSGSVLGLAVTLLNQVMMYTFYFTVEKPHMKEIFGPATAVKPGMLIPEFA